MAGPPLQLDGFELRQRGVGERERTVRPAQVERRAGKGDAGMVIRRELEQGHLVAEGAIGHFVGETRGIRDEESQQLRQLGFRVEAIAPHGHLQVGVVERVVVQDHDHRVRPPRHRRIGHHQFQAVARGQVGRRRQHGEMVEAGPHEFDRRDGQRRAAAVGHRQDQVGRRPDVDRAEIQLLRERGQARQSEGDDGLGVRRIAGAERVPFRADAEIVQRVVRQARHLLERAGHRAVRIARHVVGRREAGRRGDVEAIAERAGDFRPAGREGQDVGRLGVQAGRHGRDAGCDRGDGGIDLRIGHLVAGQESLVDDLGVEGRILDPDLEHDGQVLVRFQGETGGQVRRVGARHGQDAAARARDQQIVDPDDVRAVHARRTDEPDGRSRGHVGADVRAEPDVVRVVRRPPEAAQFRPAGRAVGGDLDRHVFVDGVQPDALVVERQGGGGVGRQVRAPVDRLVAAGEAQRVGLVHAVVELDLDVAGRRAVGFAFFPVAGPGARAVVVGIHPAAELVAERFGHGERRADPATLGDVGDAGRQGILDGHAGLRFAAAVVDRQRIGDDVAGLDRAGRSRGFRQVQQRLDRLDRRRGSIVAGRDVHLVRRRQRRHVGDDGPDGVGFHDGGDFQDGLGQGRQRADAPDAGAAVVGPLPGHVRQIDDAGRQEVRHFHAGGFVRTEVGCRQGIDHPAVHRRDRGRRGFAEPDVHAGHGDFGEGFVVGHGQVRHVRAGNPGTVGERAPRRAGVHRRGNLELHGRADVELPDAPDAGPAVVGSAFGLVGGIGQAGDQGFQHADAGRVGRALVGDDQKIGDGVALVRMGLVHGLGDAEIRVPDAVRHRSDDRRGLLVARHGRHVQQLGHGAGIDDQRRKRHRQGLAGRQSQIGRQHRRRRPRRRVGAGPRHPGAVRHVQRAGRQEVFDPDARVHDRAEIRHHDRIGDHVAGRGIIHHVRGLRDDEAADGNFRGVRIVAGDRIRPVRRRDPADVGERRSERAGFHLRHQGQERRRTRRQRPDAPRARNGVVGALAGTIRNVDQPVGQRFRDLQPRNVRRPRIRQCDRVRDLRGLVGRRIVHGFEQPHVGAGDQDLDFVCVVGQIGIHLVVVGDGRHVGPAVAAGARRRFRVDLQGGGGPGRQGADGPGAGPRIVGALAGRGGDVGEAGRQRIGHRHAGCRVRRAGVGDNQREDDRIPFVQFGGAGRLFDGQIDFDDGIHDGGRQRHELHGAGGGRDVGDRPIGQRIVHDHGEDRFQPLARRQRPARRQMGRIVDRAGRFIADPHQAVGAGAAVAVGAGIGLAAGTAAAVGHAVGADPAGAGADGAVAAVERRADAGHAVGDRVAARPRAAGPAAAGAGAIAAAGIVVAPAAMAAAIRHVADAEVHGPRSRHSVVIAGVLVAAPARSALREHDVGRLEPAGLAGPAVLRFRARAVAADAAVPHRDHVALERHDGHRLARIGSARAAAAGGRIAPRPAAATAAAPGLHRDAGDARRGHERRGSGVDHGRGGRRRLRHRQAAGHVGGAGRNRVVERHPRMRLAAGIAGHDDVGDRVPGMHGNRHVGRLGQGQGTDGQDRRGFVVVQIRIGQIERDDPGAVGDRGIHGAARDRRLDPQRCRGVHAQIADRPEAAAADVGPLRNRVAGVDQAVGQGFRHLEPGGHRRAGIGDDHRIDHGLALDGRQRLHRLRQRHVRAVDQHRGGGGVVAGIRIFVAAGGDRRDVGQDEPSGTGGRDRIDGQAGCGAGGQRPDRPDARRVGVGALAGRRGDERQAGRQRIVDLHGRDVVRPAVRHRHDELHGRALGDRAGFRGFGDGQIGRLDPESGGGRVVGRVGVRTVHAGHGGDVGHVAAAGTRAHGAGDGQDGGGGGREFAEIPEAGHGAERPRGGPVAGEGEGRGQGVRHLDQRGVGRAGVGDGQREDDFVADVRVGGRDGLAQAQIARREIEARVHAQVGFARSEDVGFRDARKRIRIAVPVRIRPRVLRAELEAVGREELHRVGARPHALREIPAVFVGAGGGGQHAGVRVDVHQHVAQAGFAVVLDAVAVPVFPHAVADAHFQHFVEEHRAAADEVQPAVLGFHRRVGREAGGIRDLQPQRAVGGDVVGRQGIAVDHVVGRQAELVPAEIDAGQRLHGGPRRRAQGLPALGVAAHHRRFQRDARRPPVGFQHRHRPAEGRRQPVGIDGGDRGDLEAVVAAAVHHEEPALVGEVVVREARVEDVVDALDVVVVAVAVALVGEHVVRPAVHQVAAQGFHHRAHQRRFQIDVRARHGRFLEEHDVVQARDPRIVHPHDVDPLGQLHVVVDVGAGFEPLDDQIVLFARVEAQVVDRGGRIVAAAAPPHGIVVVGVVDPVVLRHDARHRSHLGRGRQPGAAPDEQAQPCRRPPPLPGRFSIACVHGPVVSAIRIRTTCIRSAPDTSTQTSSMVSSAPAVKTSPSGTNAVAAPVSGSGPSRAAASS